MSRFINVHEEALGDIAINTDQIRHARFSNAVLAIYFEGVMDEGLVLQGNAASQIWNELIRIQ